MSRRRKLEKFARLLEYPHVYEMTEPGSSLVKRSLTEELDLRGLWKEKVFKTDAPLCLELACGRGEYSLGLARLYPDRSFLGLDIKGARIYQGATIALEEEINNVAFLRIKIEQIASYFAAGEIDEIWITFPDPFAAKPNRRLTSPRFLDRYYDLLSSGAFVHLKTDDDDLYEYSVEMAQKHSKFDIIEKSENISEKRKLQPELNILTYYEKRHLSHQKTIKYLLLKKID